MPLLSVQGLKVNFKSNTGVSRAVDGISFDVEKGETVCLVGESGCGKTVSSLAIMGLVPSPPGEIAEGKVLFKGMDLLDLDDDRMRDIRGNQIAMVFQEPMNSLNPVFTIGDQIKEAITTHENVDEREARQRSERLLRDVGIPSPKERLMDYPHQLSGGQRQRVMIAMALACNPDLVIADEPTTALDVTVQAQILQLFGVIQEERKMSLLYITHDLGVVADIAHRIYVMYAGVIAEQARSSDIFKNPCHPYTRGLLESLPSRANRGKPLYSIRGDVPDPAYKPKGCPFHPRCDYAVKSCRSEFPDMYDFGDGHKARCPVLANGGDRR
ncbi:dipeptide transporter; ATP-binding component of ABC superfamily [uncultured Desulfobacterium sp.]|uniref:Dipeptide transporter ATP-binding component of ABC superfamily n=1 Tax=uncultured Desulfobacterium sp. TaxID=201089 RepID=A0A445N3R7_9BACT|nr:dipeptide transporter; ATP-binding component of ABC superfamily [uncultured Desulfobacterium sp.]